MEPEEKELSTCKKCDTEFEVTYIYPGKMFRVKHWDYCLSCVEIREAYIAEIMKDMPPL